MKTYAISLKRTKERYNYIKKHLERIGVNYQIIDAVDGKKLSQEELKFHCDIEQIKKINREKKWLKKGHIGNVLSHLECYKAIVASDHNAGFVVEDDIILPNNINDILSDIEVKINKKEVILLYYISRTPCKLSSIGKAKLNTGELLFPMNFKPCTTSAYVISKEAAKEMIKVIKPITTNIDSWKHFYELKAFSSFRVLYPIKIKSKFFRTTLQDDNSLRYYFSKFVENYKIPILYQFLRSRRKRLRKSKQEFKVVDEVSPIFKNLISQRRY